MNQRNHDKGARDGDSSLSSRLSISMGPATLSALLIWAVESAQLFAQGGRGAWGASGATLGLLGLSLTLLGITLRLIWRLIAITYRFEERPPVRDVLSWLFALMIGGGGLIYGVQWAALNLTQGIRRGYYRALVSGLAALFIAALVALLTPWIARGVQRSLHRVRIFNAWVVPQGGQRWAILTLGGVLLYVGLSLPPRLSPQLHTLDLRPVILAIAWLYSLFCFSVTSPLTWRSRPLNPLWVLSIVPLSLAGLIYAGFGGMGDAALTRLKRDTTLASLALEGARRLTDRDGDGASSFFSGGDCDDRQPRIHPGAYEPLGGADLNCNGLTTKAKRDPWRPRSKKTRTRGARPKIRPLESQSKIHRSKEEEGERDSTPPKHLILLTLDALRYDSFLTHMPRLRAFARQSVDFSAAYSAGAATYWSLPALLGSKPPSRFKMGRDQTPVNAERLFPEVLRDQKFHTALFSNVTIFFVRGLRQGALVTNYDTSKHTKHGARPGAKHMTDSLLNHLDAWRDKRLSPHRDRFFLWGHYYDPHDPYFEVPEFPAKGQSDRDRYEAIVRALDDQLGRLIDGIKARGLLDETVIVITSDHGDEFGDHGHRFHGHSLYEEMVHVPLLISSPNLISGEVKAPISHIDLAPTLIDHLGLKGDRKFLGESWSQWLKGPRETRLKSASDVFFEILPDTNYNHHLIGLRRGPLKLIYHVSDHSYELYDLDLDPRERDNLFPIHPESMPLKRALDVHLEHHLLALSRRESGATPPSGSPPQSKKKRRK